MQVSSERDYVMKIRLKFSKKGYIRYVGHLDTMRMFQRAIKVAKLPIAYSQGFNPHSLIYFAMPLAVGVTSEGEYMEIVLKEDMSPSEVKERLSEVLVDGITLLDAYAIEDKTDSLMSLVAAADYELTLKLPQNQEVTADTLNEKMTASNELIVMKKGKKGINPVDIKPLVLNAEITDTQEGIHIALKVYAGSSKNLNPELLVKALVEDKPFEMQLMRKELYAEGENSLIPLYNVGRL